MGSCGQGFIAAISVKLAGQVIEPEARLYRVAFRLY